MSHIRESSDEGRRRLWLFVSVALGQGGLPFALPPEGLDLIKHERAIICAALEMHGWNQSATARHLNLPRHKLIYRIQQFGLTRDS